MKITLIINPCAGMQRKKLKKLLLKQEEKEIIEFFRDKGQELTVKRTTKNNNGTKIAEKVKNCDVVIAAGGDGTINEVINGLKDTKRPLGIIPLGSENVLAKELKIPLNVKKACQIILKMKIKEIDVGMANNKKFIFVTGIGFDALAIKNIQPRIKALVGKHSYTVAGLKTLFSNETKELAVKIDGKKEKVTGYFVIVSNLKKYGGNMRITPDAEIDDGFLDICVFKRKDVWNMVKYLIGARTGQIKKISSLEHHKIKHAIITSKHKVLFHRDAEIGGIAPVDIHVMPKGIRIITP